ncbi:MAG: M1 family aminopeptidase [Candidatus Binatia bacterium]|nr:M1 family aminopeptidase [Candidatus Binatia bacterium]
MLAWARSLARAALGLVEAGAWLVALLVLVSVFVCWHTLQAPDLRVMRQVLARVQTLVANQTTEALSLHARVEADRREIVAAATLRIRQTSNTPAAPLYFLLDPGLRVQHVTIESPERNQIPVHWVQIGPLVQIFPPRMSAAEQRVRIRYAGQPLLHPADCRIDATEVLLPPDCLWYPMDGQSFFSLEASIELPANWERIDSAGTAETYWRGLYREHRWETHRAVAGFSLVAGAYRYHERWAGEVRLRVYVPAHDPLDPAALLDTMESAYGALTSRLGPSGFPVLSLFVHPALNRAFHDGAGSMGIPRRSLASEDGGFALVAHELAHSWWGATVTGGWLRAGTGAQWIIEGFAEASSLLATESVYGRDALVKRLLGEFYDPQQQQALVEMTVLDNALPEAHARETIYRKGAYVLWMLRRIVGDNAFFSGLTELVHSYAQKEAGVAEVQEIFERASGQDLSAFFDDFVRGRATLDFSLDPASPGTLSLTNVGTAKWQHPVTVIIRAPDSAATRELEVIPPAEIPIGAANAEVLVDPYLHWADVTRENNRYPRREEPLSVTASDRGILVVSGEGFPWSKTRVRLEPTAGEVKEWEFPRGLLGPPRVDGEHGWFVLNVAASHGDTGKVVVVEADGSRREVGAGRAPVPADGGAILVAAGNRVVRYGPSGRARTLLRLPNERVEMIVPLASAGHFALVTTDKFFSNLLVQRDATARVETVFRWERSPQFVVWRAADESFFVSIPNGWVWEVWQLSPDVPPARPLVQGAVLLSDLALSPEGNLLAFVAAPARRYPRTQRQVFVLDLSERRVQHWSDPDLDFTQVAWAADNALLAIARRIPPDRPLLYPWSRTIVRLRVGQDGLALEASP